ncbi:MAG: tubulin-like doman-containing protein, partial [Chloroflexi bacterium]|nr:tubulin-like doman-containing protein [Chloroflexota bacterium]
MPQTLVVGLGRPGRVSLEHLKRRIEQTYGELPAVKLLALDVSGGAALNGDTNLGPTELLELPLDAGVSVGDTKSAFSMTRVDARLAWHANLDMLYPFLVAQLNEIGSVAAWEAMEAKGFVVTAERNEATLIVLAGLGDMVGGGLLVDVTYLAEHLFRNAGLQSASSAILFMPPLSQPDPAAEARAYAT